MSGRDRIERRLVRRAILAMRTAPRHLRAVVAEDILALGHHPLGRPIACCCPLSLHIRRVAVGLADLIEKEDELSCKNRL